MRHLFFTMAIACVAAMAMPAAAQQQQKQQGQNQQRQQQQTQQNQQQVSRQKVKRHVNGELLSYRTVEFAGQQEAHVLAKVRTNQGQTAVLDLGPVSNLRRQNVQLQRGQQIEATGRTGRINKLPVLIVDRYIGDGEFTVIAFEPVSRQLDQQRSARAQQRQQTPQQFGMDQPMRGHAQRMRGADRGRQPDQLQQVSVEGQLIDLRGVQISGLPDTHRVAKLRTRSGQNIVVDLGTDQQLSDLRLQRNETVTVVGKMGRINGRPVLFADAVADIARIDRTQEQQFQRQWQQQQRQRQQQSQQRQQFQRNQFDQQQQRF